MKLKCLGLLGLMLTANAMATTTLNVYESASVNQLQEAQLKISEAILAKREGNQERANSLLKEAKNLMSGQNVEKVFNAAIMAKYDNQYSANYFELEYRYNAELEDTCFVGSVEDANQLFTAAEKEDLLNFDETWYGDSKVLDENTLQVTMFDGPNEWTEDFTISKCQ